LPAIKERVIRYISANNNYIRQRCYINSRDLNKYYETLKPLKVPNLKCIILVVFCLISLQTLGQGVPKAYEVVNYQCNLSGRTVKFMLANGYIGASAIKIIRAKMKPLRFVPAAAVADEQNSLKFVSARQDNPDYFILENMQDGYEELPALINGKYHSRSKTTPVKLWLLKNARQKRR
jgi:hypothetical protein